MTTTQQLYDAAVSSKIMCDSVRSPQDFTYYQVQHQFSHLAIVLGKAIEAYEAEQAEQHQLPTAGTGLTGPGTVEILCP